MGLAGAAGKAAAAMQELTGSVSMLRAQAAQPAPFRAAAGPAAPTIVMAPTAPVPVAALPTAAPSKPKSDREAAEDIRRGQRTQEMTEIVNVITRELSKKATK